jgi:Ni/Co efflux regulator RcnB
MKRLIIAVSISVLCAFTAPVAKAIEVGASVTFSNAEIQIISAWYSDHQTTHHGKSKKGKRKGLPPGIAKNLNRGKSLPPGIAKQHLPSELRQELPQLPIGYERIIVDGKVLLVEVATQVIHDVLRDVILD